jgi:hypothetical protein
MGATSSYAKCTLQVPKLVLVKLAPSHLTNILGIPKWGVGSIPPHVSAKVEKDENLASLIGGSKVAYANELFGVGRWFQKNLDHETRKTRTRT